MRAWPSRCGRSAAVAVLLAIAFLAVRYELATTATLSETYYDEALTGLMSLAILRGVPQVFYWGQPYLGAADAYVAAAAFYVFGASTLVLRMAAAVVSVLWAWAAWSMGRRMAGEWAGLLAGLYMAVPPIFLSYLQLSSHGETYAEAWGVLVLAAAACLLDPAVALRDRRVAWVVLGLAGGLGWWETQMMGMFLVAAALALVVARPHVLRTPGPWVALGLFFLASLPFWVWNWRHEWATFRHLLSWGGPLPPLSERVGPVVGAFLATLAGYFWDGRAVTLPPAARWLEWLLVATVYVPAVGLAAARAGTWCRRLARRERPWQDPLDVVVLAFWGTVAAHLVTWFGASGILRYSMTFYATMPVLIAVVLARLAPMVPAGRVIAVGLAVGLLGYNALTHVIFIRDAAGRPYRPVDAMISRLETLGIRGCYADSRVAQVIAFESRERIQCADLYGYRNFSALQAVDAIDDPAAVALVAHWTLQSPSPEVVTATLQLMGAEVRADRVGEYVIFHHARPPDPRVRPIPPIGWSARASAHAEQAPRVFDRQVWTRWSTTKQGGEWLELDLGRSHRLAGLTLEAGPFPIDGPAGLRVETSPNGRVWDIAAQAAGLLPGMHWWKGHLRADESGRVIVHLAGHPTRYVRIVQTGRDQPGVLWSVSEVFAYEVADAPWAPPAAADAAHAQAQAELAHWMDDPGGPHPRRAPVTYEHRRSQVPWAAVFAAATRAIELRPEWDEAHHLYARALTLWGWTEAFDVAVARARADGAWEEVIRWAQAAEAESPALWRSGRLEARVDALRRLGRVADVAGLQAAAARAEAAQQPVRRLHARFDNGLELTGVALPGVARRGERVSLRYAWRASRRPGVDFTAFVHLEGQGRRLIHDHVLGGEFGTSRWWDGERVVETLPLIVPADAPPGTYHVRVGVWRPETGRRARVEVSYLPHDRTAVAVGTLEIRD